MQYQQLMQEFSPTRRRLLLGSALATLAAAAGHRAYAAQATQSLRHLVAKHGSAQLAPTPYPQTAIWGYNGSVPGPELRLRQGERLRVAVENLLDEETTVHWHGIRLPNAMDGVPHLTQKPIAAEGGKFLYEFNVLDAGTYWYHPHQRGYEQVARGLYGALIVEEPEPPVVDRDITWILDDWRLDRDASIRGGFGNYMDLSHAGRIGNTVTVNGKIPETFEVRAGERIRLRLINAANARIFALEFAGHQPRIIALDGQPVTPHEPEGGRIVLGPAMRADIILDMTGKPEQRHAVTDPFYRRLAYKLLDMVYAAEPLRATPLESEVRLPPNPLPEPDLATAARHEVLFSGGMMGNMRGMSRGMAWAINGVSQTEHVHEPLLTLQRNSSNILRLVNDTAWHHPIHLHGHSFRVISRNGKPTRHREWLDTVLVAPREITEIAFVADNPGDWMFHCHILEHQAAGMMSTIRVA
jgi:FtsP/CotA-like multicopper oxidase with cupredoxin domain